MSITYAAEETCWFPVIDPEAFKEFCETLDVAFQQDASDPSRFRLSAYNEDGCWPSYLEPPHQFERWPMWHPLPPEGEERIRQIAAEQVEGNDPERAREIWMTTPDEWPDELEFEFFDAVIRFMVPGSHMTTRWCVFDSPGYDLGIGGSIIYQDGRTVRVDFDDALETVMARVDAAKNRST